MSYLLEMFFPLSDIKPCSLLGENSPNTLRSQQAQILMLCRSQLGEEVRWAGAQHSQENL